MNKNEIYINIMRYLFLLRLFRFFRADMAKHHNKFKWPKCLLNQIVNVLNLIWSFFARFVILCQRHDKWLIFNRYWYERASDLYTICNASKHDAIISKTYLLILHNSSIPGIPFFWQYFFFVWLKSVFFNLFVSVKFTI